MVASTKSIVLEAEVLEIVSLSDTVDSLRDLDEELRKLRAELSIPVICLFPNDPQTNAPDPVVQKYSFHDYPIAEYTPINTGRLYHHSLRFSIIFRDDNSCSIPRYRRSTFPSGSDRINHDAALRHKLVEDEILSREGACRIEFLYDACPRSGNPYVDIVLPFWSQMVAGMITRPGYLGTLVTELEWLGPQKGRGPIAPPQYAMAVMTAPFEVVPWVEQGSDFDAFEKCCHVAQESFQTWTDRHRTGQCIVAWGGFFKGGDTTSEWSHKIFAIYRVPVSPSNIGTTNTKRLKADLCKFPGYTMFGIHCVRNSLNFRMGCPECNYNATFIHGMSEHTCGRCHLKGHVQKSCGKVSHGESEINAIYNLPMEKAYGQLWAIEPQMLAYAQEMAKYKAWKP